MSAHQAELQNGGQPSIWAAVGSEVAGRSAHNVTLGCVFRITFASCAFNRLFSAATLLMMSFWREEITFRSRVSLSCSAYRYAGFLVLKEAEGAR